MAEAREDANALATDCPGLRVTIYGAKTAPQLQVDNGRAGEDFQVYYQGPHHDHERWALSFVAGWWAHARWGAPSIDLPSEVIEVQVLAQPPTPPQ